MGAEKTFIQVLLEKVTTRNIIALSVTATVLIAVLQMTFNAQALVVIVKENTEWVITGAFIFGVLTAKWADIVQFFFRKPQAKETTSSK
jgi:hypothetical protein